MTTLCKLSSYSRNSPLRLSLRGRYGARNYRIREDKIFIRIRDEEKSYNAIAERYRWVYLGYIDDVEVQL
jgi:hypothetical protein